MVMVTFTLEVTASGNCVRFFFFREYLVFDRRSKSTSLRPPDGWHDVPFLWYDIRRPQDVFSLKMKRFLSKYSILTPGLCIH